MANLKSGVETIVKNGAVCSAISRARLPEKYPEIAKFAGLKVLGKIKGCRSRRGRALRNAVEDAVVNSRGQLRTDSKIPAKRIFNQWCVDEVKSALAAGLPSEVEKICRDWLPNEQ